MLQWFQERVNAEAVVEHVAVPDFCSTSPGTLTKKQKAMRKKTRMSYASFATKEKDNIHARYQVYVQLAGKQRIFLYAIFRFARVISLALSLQSPHNFTPLCQGGFFSTGL